MTSILSCVLRILPIRQQAHALIEQALAEARKRFVPGSPAAEAGLPKLARNPSLIEKLTSDPSAEVQANLALNKGAPAAVLGRLVSDETSS